MTPDPAPPRVSAIIVSYRSAGVLPQLLGQLTGDVDEVIVVDNASDDGSADAAAAAGGNVTVLRRRRNDGFAAGVNAGAAAAGGTHLLLCNPDLRPEPGTVAALLAAAGRHPGDVVGPVLRLPDGRRQPSRSGLPTLWNLLGEQLLVPESVRPGSWPARLWPRWRGYDREEIAPLLSGACLLVPRATWDRVGPMDEGYFLYWEEIDWQLRAQRAGARSWLVPSAVAVHARAGSTAVHAPRRAELLHQSTRRFVRRWFPPGRQRAALALLACGQLARVIAWTLPPLRSRPGARGRRDYHLAGLRALRGRPPVGGSRDGTDPDGSDPQ